jgi:hypothetical protein
MRAKSASACFRACIAYVATGFLHRLCEAARESGIIDGFVAGAQCIDKQGGNAFANGIPAPALRVNEHAFAHLIGRAFKSVQF